jgi:hypothetical protein
MAAIDRDIALHQTQIKLYARICRLRHINGRPGVSGQTADAAQLLETTDACFAWSEQNRPRLLA